MHIFQHGSHGADWLLRLHIRSRGTDMLIKWIGTWIRCAGAVKRLPTAYG